FSATQGGANPAPQTVSVTNGGGGTLSGLAIGTIRYGAGQDRKSVGEGKSGSAGGGRLTVRATSGSLPAGSYTATVPMVSTGASNSSHSVRVTFVVVPKRQISRRLPCRCFGATQGGANPAPQTVSVTNGGGGTLSGLAIGTIRYGAG